MATVNLGKIKLVNRGTWASGTTYTEDDIVQYTDGNVTSTYICVVSSSQGHTPSSSGTTHASWDFLAKGQDQLPSQSGQSGKFLTTNGSALSFGTVTQDWVKVNSSGAVSGSTIGWDNLYSSDYDVYKILCLGLYKAGSGNVRFRFRNSSGSIITNGNYLGHAIDSGSATDDNYYSNSIIRSTNDDSVYIHDAFSTNSAYKSYIEYTVWNPLTTFIPCANWKAEIWDGTSWAEQSYGTIRYRSTESTRGAIMYCQSGNTLYASDIVVYGLKC